MESARPRASVFIATSVDGFIARADGALDWLDRANATVPAGEDCGYAAFIADVDVLVLGRKTFDTARGFPEWPYGARRVVVWSRGGVDVPEALRDRVSASSEAPAAMLARLGREGLRHAYVDGGEAVRAFLAAGVIDAITVTLIPVLLGAGRPLFGALPKDVPLELVASRSWDFGFAQLTYAVGAAR